MLWLAKSQHRRARVFLAVFMSGGVVGVIGNRDGRDHRDRRVRPPRWHRRPRQRYHQRRVRSAARAL